MAIKIIAQLGVNKTGFDAGMRSAKQQIGAFASSVKGQLAGLVGFSVIAAGISSAAKRAGELRDMAEGLGITIERLQEMDFAMKQGSASIDDYARSLIGISKAIERVKSGGNASLETIAAFRRLGVSMDDIKKKGLDELFLLIGRRIKEAKDIQDVYGDALLILGKSAAKVFAAMKGGLEETAQAARDTGNVIREQTMQDLADLANQFDAAKGSAGLFFSEIIVGVSKVIPHLAALRKSIIAYVGEGLGEGAGRFMEEGPDIPGTPSKLGGLFSASSLKKNADKVSAMFSAASIGAAKAYKDTLDQYETKRQADLNARAARQSVRSALLDEDFEQKIEQPKKRAVKPEIEREHIVSASRGSLTSLQQIGALVRTPHDPMTDKLVRYNKMIAENTKATADAVKNGGAAFP